MSASSPSSAGSPLKNPVLIVFLVVAIAGVTVLNLKTFGNKEQAPRRYQAAVMDGPAVPPDLPLLVREVASSTARDLGQPDQGQPRSVALGRDPFKSDHPAQPQASVARTAPTRTAPAPQALTCTAVLTRGEQASARINGRFYPVGSRVRGYTVAWVASNGVTLKDAAGRSKFLPLRQEKSGRQAFQVQVGANRK